MSLQTNDECLEEMQKTAQQLGYTVCRMQIFGDIKDAVKEILGEISKDEKDVHLFWGGDNAQGSRKRKGREKSRTGFKDAEKHTKIKQNGYSVNGNRRY